MTVACESFIRTNSHHLNNYWKKTILFLFIREIFSLLSPGRTKWAVVYLILIQELLKPNNEHTYNLRHTRQFKTPSVNTVYHDIDSVSFLVPKIWEILLDFFWKIDNIDAIKKAIKTWQPSNRLYRFCRVYVQNIGFLWSLLNYNDIGHLKS